MLLEFFPKIPGDACTEILEHGFQKGSGRVGRSKTLEDKLKVQLAVNAHIRHRQTQYDSILAANKEQNAKLAAREMVHSQVQAIADSWRATSSQTGNAKSGTSVPKGSATTLEANRRRRAIWRKARKNPVDEAQVLQDALDGLRLNEFQGEMGSRAEAAQRIVQKKAQKAARKDRFKETTRELLRQYELDPSIEMSKKKKKEVVRLQMEQNERPRKGKYTRNVHERQEPMSTKPTKRAVNRRLRVTANGVELEPIELDRYVPDCGQSNDQSPEPRGNDTYVPDHGPSDDQPRKPRLLRSNYRLPGNTPTNSRDLGDTPGDGVQLEARGHDRYVPTCSPNFSNDPPRKSRYPFRSSHRTPGDFHDNNEKVLGPIEEPTSEGRLLVEDSEWMDIDDISLRTAGVRLT